MSEVRNRASEHTIKDGNDPKEEVSSGKVKSTRIQSRVRNWFMVFLVLSIVCCTLMHLYPTSTIVRCFSAYSLGVFFISAGANHFNAPKFYLPLMPPFLPFHLPLIYVSGVLEIIGGLACFYSNPRFLNHTAWFLILLLLAVFPANIWLAVSEPSRIRFGATQQSSLIRLPMQLIFWLWCYQLTNKSLLASIQDVSEFKFFNHI